MGSDVDSRVVALIKGSGEDAGASVKVDGVQLYDTTEDRLHAARRRKRQVGLFTVEEWAPGQMYNRNCLFRWRVKIGKITIAKVWRTARGHGIRVSTRFARNNEVRPIPCSPGQVYVLPCSYGVEGYSAEALADYTSVVACLELDRMVRESLGESSELLLGPNLHRRATT